MDGQPRLLNLAASRPWGGHRSRRRFLGALLSTLALLCVLHDPLSALLAKSAADPFFHSTSAGAAAVLLGLCALSLLRLATAAAVPGQASLQLAAVVLVAAILAGNGANLLMHLALLDSHGLPSTLAVYHWAGDTNTYSYVLHAHTGKVALHALLSDWAGGLVQGFDIGAGLAAEVPVGGAALCVLCLLASVAAYLWLLPAATQRWRGAALPLLLAFCALNAIKTIADGGPLTYRFAPVLAVLLWLLSELLGLSRRWIWAGAALGAAMLLLSAAASWLLAGAQFDEALHGLLATVAVIALLLAWAWTPVSAQARRWRSALGLGGAGAVLVSLAASLMSGPAALLLPLPEGMRATHCNGSGACVAHEVAGQSAFEVYRHAGDDPLKPRHTLLALRGAEGDSRLLMAIQPLHTGPVQRRAGPDVTTHPVQALKNGAGVLVEARSGSLPVIFNGGPGAFTAQNYYVFLHQTAASLRAQGLQDFIMAPVRSAADAQALGLSVAARSLSP